VVAPAGVTDWSFQYRAAGSQDAWQQTGNFAVLAGQLVTEFDGDAEVQMRWSVGAGCPSDWSASKVCVNPS
jgi:hypothetical protein